MSKPRRLTQDEQRQEEARYLLKIAIPLSLGNAPQQQTALPRLVLRKVPPSHILFALTERNESRRAEIITQSEFDVRRIQAECAPDVKDGPKLIGFYAVNIEKIPLFSQAMIDAQWLSRL